MRLSVPSTFTTMGPRWSSLIDVLPLLMSSGVVEVEVCGASGSARGALGGVGSEFEVVVEEELDSVEEEYVVEVMVNGRCAGIVRVGRVDGIRRAKVRRRDGICEGEELVGCA